MVPQIPGMPKLVLFFYSKCGGDDRLEWLSLPISLDLVPQFCGIAHKCKTIKERSKMNRLNCGWTSANVS